MKLGEVCFLTNDVRRLADFYRRLFRIDEENEDEAHQMIVTGDVDIAVYNDGTPKNNQNQNLCVAFTVDDVNAEHARLKALGAVILDPPETRPWGARNLRFLDPDGNQIYLRSIPRE